MEAPPIKLSTKRIIVIDAKIILCSPFPPAPRYCEIKMAISKLKIAAENRTLKLPIIALSISYFLILKQSDTGHQIVSQLLDN